MTGHEMAGWHHRLSGHEFEQTWKDSEGLGGLARCSPWNGKPLQYSCLENPTNNMKRRQDTER